MRHFITSWFSSNTYQLHKPFRSPIARGFLLLALLALALTLLAQGIGLSPVSAVLPPPGLETRNPEFNAKINYIEAFVRRYGQVDCLLLGSSHIDYGLDPALISQAYQSKTGQEIRCFNFGLASLTPDTAAPLAKMLINRYHPRLLIFEVSAHSFDKRFGDLARPLIKNPWIRYQLGEQTPKGWLLAHFHLYGYYRTFKLWQHPYSRDIMLNAWKKMDDSGYSAHQGQEQQLFAKDTTSGFDFRIEPSMWQGFQEVLALNGQTRIILLEAPIQTAFLPDYILGGKKAYETKFIPPVQAELSTRDIPFWRAQVEIAPQVPDSMWFDPQHLNAQGAALLSNWLAQKLATIVP